jgi:hypothetical protein
MAAYIAKMPPRYTVTEEKALAVLKRQSLKNYDRVMAGEATMAIECHPTTYNVLVPTGSRTSKVYCKDTRPRPTAEYPQTSACELRLFYEKLMAYEPGLAEMVFEMANHVDVAGCVRRQFERWDGEMFMLPPLTRTIDVNAFSNSKLAVVNLCGVVDIKTDAFSNTRLSQITFPSTVRSIGPRVLYYCMNLKTVRMSNHITHIPFSMVEKCPELSMFWISTACTTIGGHAFASTSLLKTIVPRQSSSKVATIGTLAIPSSVTTIQNYAFSYSGVSLVTLPMSITDIGVGCFEVSSLTSVDLSQCNITVIPKLCFHNCRYLTSVRLPNTVTVIGQQSFSKCKKLNHVRFPSSLNAIGDNAFELSGLTVVEMPDSIAWIGTNVFGCCVDLCTVHLSDRLESIPTGTFAGCKSLLELTGGSSVTFISGSAFTVVPEHPDLKIPIVVPTAESRPSKRARYSRDRFFFNGRQQ